MSCLFCSGTTALQPAELGTRHGGDNNSFGLVVPISEVEKLSFVEAISLGDPEVLM